MRSTDGGDNWILIDSIDASDVVRHPTGSLYHLSGVVFRKSDDNGITWDTLPDLDPVVKFYKEIHIDVNGNIFVWTIDFCCAGPIYRYAYSTDNGSIFNFLDTPYSSVFNLATTSSNKIIVSNSKEVHISEGINAPWKNINQGIPPANRISHLFVDKDDYIYAGMFGDVIYKSIVPTSQITSTNFEKHALLESTIFPNPFNDIFRLEFENNLAQEFMFQLNNQNGVTELEKKFTGKTLEVKRNNLPSGIYFYNIFSNEKIISSGKVIAQ